jgi:hypothetical protein
MASKRHIRRKRCERKRKYPNLASATYAVFLLRQRHPHERFSSYRHGGHWHVGHSPRSVN